MLPRICRSLYYCRRQNDGQPAESRSGPILERLPEQLSIEKGRVHVILRDSMTFVIALIHSTSCWVQGAMANFYLGSSPECVNRKVVLTPEQHLISARRQHLLAICPDPSSRRGP